MGRGHQGYQPGDLYDLSPGIGIGGSRLDPDGVPEMGFFSGTLVSEFNEFNASRGFGEGSF